jgi:hypothetical protein
MNCHYNGLHNILNLTYYICKYNLYLLFKIGCIGQMFYCAADESLLIQIMCRKVGTTDFVLSGLVYLFTTVMALNDSYYRYDESLLT